MNIKDSSVYEKNTVVFDSQSVLDNKKDKLNAMVEKLTTQSINQSRPSNLNFIKEKEEMKEGLIIMTEVCSKADIDKTVETDTADHHIEVDLSMGGIIQEEILDTEILGEDTEETLGIIVILTGIEVDPETDNFQKTTEEMTVVAVGQDQNQEQLLIETE